MRSNFGMLQEWEILFFVDVGGIFLYQYLDPWFWYHSSSIFFHTFSPSPVLRFLPPFSHPFCIFYHHKKILVDTSSRLRSELWSSLCWKFETLCRKRRRRSKSSSDSSRPRRRSSHHHSQQAVLRSQNYLFFASSSGSDFQKVSTLEPAQLRLQLCSYLFAQLLN